MKFFIDTGDTEEIKLAIGCATPPPDRLSMVVKGRDLSSGTPRQFEISGEDTAEALSDAVAQTEDGIATSGPSLPLTFGMGTLTHADPSDGSYSVRRDGLTVRGTAIAQTRPASRVGLPQPAAGVSGVSGATGAGGGTVLDGQLLAASRPLDVKTPAQVPVWTYVLIIGLLAGSVPYIFCTVVKKMFGYDDALDTFGVHAIGNFLVAVLGIDLAAQPLRGDA